MLGEDLTPFERVSTQENINHRINEEKIKQTDTNTANPDCNAYMEAPITEFENVSAWVSVAVANAEKAYAMVI